jgi:hypothetical protein
MPFTKGNQLSKGKRNRHNGTQPKTIWLLQSLAENGVDLQKLLAHSIIKASRGDRQALELSHLLAKFLPLVANAPKTDTGVLQIETLVINRLESKPTQSIDTTAIEPEGNPPLVTDGLNAPSSPEAK